MTKNYFDVKCNHGQDFPNTQKSHISLLIGRLCTQNPKIFPNSMMLDKFRNNLFYISYYLGLSPIFQQKYFSTSQIAPTSLILMPLSAQPFSKVGMKKNDIKDEVKKLLKLMTTLKKITK